MDLKDLTALSEAIDAFDVGASIADDDVELWNEVLKQRNALRDALQKDL